MAYERRRKQFPWGHVLQILVMLLGLWAATVRLESRIARLEVKVDALWNVYIEQRRNAFGPR